MTAIDRESWKTRSGFLAGIPEASLAGLELGAYKLVRPLGQGGMGTVWLTTRSDGRFEGTCSITQ